MSISGAWKEIVYWINEYTGGNAVILILAIDAAIYLMFVNKDIRKRIIIPLVVLVPIVINPILYKYIYHDQRYWRFFWMLPDAVLIGLAVADLCSRIRKNWIKCAALVVIAGSLALIGTNMFLPTEENLFLPATGVRKLTPETMEACGIIEQDNPNPKCVFNDYICIQSRQYSENFTQMYGRDVDGFIMGNLPGVKEIAEVSWYTVKDKDMDRMFAFGKENGYTHFCLRTMDGLDEIAEKYGYTLLKQFGVYSIYH